MIMICGNTYRFYRGEKTDRILDNPSRFYTNSQPPLKLTVD